MGYGRGVETRHGERRALFGLLLGHLMVCDAQGKHLGVLGICRVAMPHVRTKAKSTLVSILLSRYAIAGDLVIFPASS